MLKESDLFYEGDPFVGRKLEDAFESKGDMLSIFLAPLARDEILDLPSPDRHVSLIDFVTDLTRRKLLRRTQQQKGIPSLSDLENIERKAKSAYELKEAWHFDHVIPNHDGEDSENWNAFYYPVGASKREHLVTITWQFISSFP
jgi:guanylate kinase